MSRVLLYEDFRGGLTGSVFAERTSPSTTVGGVSDPYSVTNGSAHHFVTGAATAVSTGLRQRMSWTGTQWNSSLIDARHSFTVSLPFRAEHRFNVSALQFASAWPSFWFKGFPDAIGSENVRGFGWPSYREIDAWEYTGNTKLWFTIHGDNPYGSGSSTHWQQPAAGTNSVTFDPSVWHTTAIEVTYDGVKWFLDGVLKMSTNLGPTSTVTNGWFPWDWKWYPILQLAIGSSGASAWSEVPMPGTPGATPQTADYLTDYVEFVDLADSGRSIIALGRRGRRR